MLQPDCLLDAPLPVLPPLPPPVDPGVPAMWFALAMFLAFAIFELWALHTGHNTISHYLQRLASRHHWVRIIGVIAGEWLIYHLFW